MKNEKSILLAIVSVAMLFGAVVLAIYVKSPPKTQVTIGQEIAKLLVQAIAIIIVGALVKFSIEQMTASRDKEKMIREEKKNLFQTIRKIHQIVLTVPFLIEQEKTLKCYQQNMSKLIEAVANLKEVGDDLQNMVLPTLPGKVHRKHIGEMIKYLNKIVLEGPQNDPKDWDGILKLPLYSKYRPSVLKLSGHEKCASFNDDYDKHYENLKNLMRAELRL